MIEGISKITRNSDYTWVDYVVDDAKAMVVMPKLNNIKADNYVEDNFEEEYRLTHLIKNICIENGNCVTSKWNKTNIPKELTKFEYYDVVVKMLYELAFSTIYKNTKRCMPNYILCSLAYLPIFAFVEGFTLNNNVGEIKGTHLVGEYNIVGSKDSIKVFVSPVLDEEESIWGVNDETSTGIITFLDENDKICNKILDANKFVLIRLED